MALRDANWRVLVTCGCVVICLCPATEWFGSVGVYCHSVYQGETTMKKASSYATIVACILGLAFVCQDFQRTVSAQENGKKAAAKQARRRLPNYYGQVGLSKQQREQVYSVQEKYGTQIEELEKQIAALREKEDSEMKAILTTEQKQKLDQLQEEATKKRDARSKKKT